MKNWILVICVLLAGCGSRPEVPKVRIANLGTGLQIGGLPITLAQALGHYREEGLDVEIENLPSAAKGLQALLGGSVDVGSVPFPNVIQIAEEGRRVRSFFVLNQRGANVIAVAPGATERIRRVEDLKGAKIGVSSAGGTTHLFANFFLGTRGVGPSDYTPIAIGIGASAVAAVESGRVDAASLAGGDHIRLLRRHPNLRILADTSTEEGTVQVYGSTAIALYTLAAKQEWLDGNPETARRLTRALRRTLQWIAENPPEKILERLPEDFRSPDVSMDIEVLRMGNGFFTRDGKMPKGAPETMKRYVDLARGNGGSTNIDLSATWTDEYLAEGK